MTRTKLIRSGTVALACAAAGAAAGIAGSAAAPSKSPTARTGPGPAGRHGMFRGRGGGPIHSSMVVPNAAGTGFETVTGDGGKVVSVSADQLKITEGTPTLTYRTVALTIPTSATINRNDAKAALSSLQAGDHVRVMQGPEGTFVNAEDPAHQGNDGPMGRWGGHRPDGGPPPPGAPGTGPSAAGPPPGSAAG